MLLRLCVPRSPGVFHPARVWSHLHPPSVKPHSLLHICLADFLLKASSHLYNTHQAKIIQISSGLHIQIFPVVMNIHSCAGLSVGIIFLYIWIHPRGK